MSVAGQPSSVKMILKKVIASLVVICGLTSASPAYTSSVFLQSGAEVLPVEFLDYVPPLRTKYAQFVAPSSMIPNYSGLSPYQSLPCVSPCGVEPLAPVTNSKLVTYQQPLPKVVEYLPVKEEPRGYQYSYVVYDEKTGDQKGQKETSDGTVVRGQYSFVQPDGYLREVQYSAGDDGFNAVVKNFLTKPDGTKAEVTEEKPVVSEDKPKSVEVEKSESKTTSSEETKSEPPKEVSGETEEESKAVSKEESKAVSKEESKEVSKEESKEVPKEEPKEVSKEEPKEESSEEPKTGSKEDSKEEPKEASKEESKEPTKEVTSTEEEAKSPEKEAPKEETATGKYYFSFQDLFRCAQNPIPLKPVEVKMEKSAVETPPLTYILFPALSATGPC